MKITLKQLKQVIKEEIDRYSNLKPVQGEEKYVEFDDETGLWCVFGVDSGFAYESYASKEDADDAMI